MGGVASSSESSESEFIMRPLPGDHLGEPGLARA